MRDIATATLTGNLTREVELRPLPSGTEVARLRVASGTRRRSGEEWVERTNYFTVEVYGPQASLCAERLGKGSRVVVDGELDWREWNDQEPEPARGRRAPRPSDPVRARALDPADAARTRRMLAGLRVRCRGGRGCAGRHGRRAVLIKQPKRLARRSADGRAASPSAPRGPLFLR